MRKIVKSLMMTKIAKNLMKTRHQFRNRKKIQNNWSLAMRKVREAKQSMKKASI